MLTAEGLTLDYGRGTELAHAVDQVTVSVGEGDFLGVIGPSGSGKSSLMYLLSGLKRPTRGRVTFEELDYGRLRPSSLMRLRRERFGFVFQQHFLINYLSVLENVLVGATVREGTSERWARELLARVGLEDKIDQRPYQLSIGQRQRVAVVRALVHRPTVVFADEPTAALDQATGRQVVEVLAEYRRTTGRSLVVVTHDPDMLLGADRVLRMRDGRLH
jgi:putative ABC transport system ATP-binding protein